MEKRLKEYRPGVEACKEFLRTANNTRSELRRGGGMRKSVAAKKIRRWRWGEVRGEQKWTRRAAPCATKMDEAQRQRKEYPKKDKVRKGKNDFRTRKAGGKHFLQRILIVLSDNKRWRNNSQRFRGLLLDVELWRVPEWGRGVARQPLEHPAPLIAAPSKRLRHLSPAVAHLFAERWQFYFSHSPHLGPHTSH